MVKYIRKKTFIYLIFWGETGKYGDSTARALEAGQTHIFGERRKPAIRLEEDVNTEL